AWGGPADGGGCPFRQVRQPERKKTTGLGRNWLHSPARCATLIQMHREKKPARQGRGAGECAVGSLVPGSVSWLTLSSAADRTPSPLLGGTRPRGRPPGRSFPRP